MVVRVQPWFVRIFENIGQIWGARSLNSTITLPVVCRLFEAAAGSEDIYKVCHPVNEVKWDVEPPFTSSRFLVASPESMGVFGIEQTKN